MQIIVVFRVSNFHRAILRYFCISTFNTFRTDENFTRTNKYFKQLRFNVFTYTPNILHRNFTFQTSKPNSYPNTYILPYVQIKHPYQTLDAPKKGVQVKQYILNSNTREPRSRTSSRKKKKKKKRPRGTPS